MEYFIRELLKTIIVILVLVLIMFFCVTPHETPIRSYKGITTQINGEVWEFQGKWVKVKGKE